MSAAERHLQQQYDPAPLEPVAPPPNPYDTSWPDEATTSAAPLPDPSTPRACHWCSALYSPRWWPFNEGDEQGGPQRECDACHHSRERVYDPQPIAEPPQELTQDLLAGMSTGQLQRLAGEGGYVAGLAGAEKGRRAAMADTTTAVQPRTARYEPPTAPDLFTRCTACGALIPNDHAVPGVCRQCGADDSHLHPDSGIEPAHAWDDDPLYRPHQYIPARLDRKCTAPGCPGVLRPVPGTDQWGADGTATIDTRCDNPACHSESFASWGWPDNEHLPAPAENPQWTDTQEDTDRSSAELVPKPPAPPMAMDMTVAGLPDDARQANGETVLGTAIVPAEQGASTHIGLMNWPDDGQSLPGRWVQVATPPAGKRFDMENDVDMWITPLLSPDEADLAATHLEDLAAQVEAGYRPAKVNKWSHVLQRLERGVTAGRINPDDKLIAVGEIDEFPLPVADLIALVKERAGEPVPQRMVVAKTAGEAGADPGAVFMGIGQRPDGTADISMVTTESDHEDPDSDFWAPYVAHMTPQQARTVAGQLRRFAQAARTPAELDDTAAPAATPTALSDVAARLRALGTDDAGRAYLGTLDLDKPALLAVAEHLGMTRLGKLSRPKLVDRIIKQAILSRDKYAGLREGWQEPRATDTSQQPGGDGK